MPSLTTTAAQVSVERSTRLRAALGRSRYDAWLTMTPANTQYATGYRSATLAVGEPVTCIAIATTDRTLLCGPVAEWPAAVVDAGVHPDDYLGYGTFHFDRADGQAGPAAGLPSLKAAVQEGIRRLGLTESAVAVDESFDPAVGAELSRAFPGIRLTPAPDWVWTFRSSKSPAELHRLRRAAELAEAGIARAVEQAGAGCTEIDLMAVVGSTMMSGGGLPQFVVVTSGPRSAHSDTYATERRLQRGDLVRFDVGCTVDGYWSDIGRTAVVGEPDALQSRRYQAILAGEQAQLEAVRPGLRASDLFALAVRNVELGGLSPYRRHHCGHGIGLDVYEPPIVNPATETELLPGMTLCVETPYYELGWGGMMVEDTVLVTPDGCEVFTGIGRSLTVIDR